jgi:hypothetical protein
MPSGITDAFGQQTPEQHKDGGRDPALDTSPTPAVDTRVPVGPALDDPLTRAALTRYRWCGRLIALVGAALFIAFFVFVTIQSQHPKWLLAHGARVPGRITDVYRSVHGSGSFGVRYVADDRAWQGTVVLTETSGYYAPGETTTVIYDPNHPSDIRTPQEKNEPNSTVLPLTLALVSGLILLLGGVGTLVRARAWRRLLATSPWRAYRVRYLARVVRGRFQPLSPGLEVEPVDSPSSSPVLLRLASTWRGRTDRMSRHDGETIWLAGDPAGRVVIGLPPTRELLAAGAPRRAIAKSYRQAASQSPSRDPGQIKKARRRLITILVAQWTLFSAASIWRTEGSGLGIAIVVLYLLSLVPVVAVLMRAQRKAT